jgi:hypothetical protein
VTLPNIVADNLLILKKWTFFSKDLTVNIYIMKAIKLVPVLFLSFGSCSSKVNSDYDQSVDFSQYKTYAFHKEESTESKSPDSDKKDS